MTRYLFCSDVLITAPAAAVAPLPPAVYLGVNQSFTLWTDRTGGTQVTDCTNPDQVTPLPLTNGFFTAGANGQPPAFYGPDAVVALWIDAGAGPRYQLLPSDLMPQLLTAAISWLASGLDGAAVAASAQKAADAQAAAQAAQTQAAQAAAAAQQAAASAAAAASGTGGGLSTTALDDYLNGTGSASAAGLLMVIPGVRRRQFVNGLRTGAWEPRPNLPVVLNVGYTPAPTDSVSWDVDLTVPTS